MLMVRRGGRGSFLGRRSKLSFGLALLGVVFCCRVIGWVMVVGASLL